MVLRQKMIFNCLLSLQCFLIGKNIKNNGRKADGKKIGSKKMKFRWTREKQNKVIVKIY